MKQYLLFILLIISFNCTATNLVDTIAPVITLNGSAYIEHILNSTYVDAGATAYDNIDGNVTSSVTSDINSANPNIDRTGIYTITYTVSDLAGNVGTATRSVRIYNEAEILETSLYNGYDSCGLSGVATFDGYIASSDSVNLLITINNFGAFGQTVSVFSTLSGIAVGATLSFSVPQLLWGTVTVVSASGIINSLNPIVFTVTYTWSDGTAQDNCVSIYITNNSVSVNEISSNSFINYFPNPTDGIIYLKGNDKRINDVYVFDINGKLVFQEKLNSNSGRIDLTDKAPGMYFLRLTTDEGQQTKRVVVE